VRSRPLALTAIGALVFLLANTAFAGRSVFEASPEDQGLLVVDVRAVWHTIFDQAVDTDAGSVTQVMPDSALGATFQAKPIEGLLIFALDPHRYRLSEFEGHWCNDHPCLLPNYVTAPFLADSLAHLAAEVDRGQVTYLGRVEVKFVPRLFGKTDIRVRLERDPKHEQQVWSTLAKRARKSAWAERVGARSAVPDSTAGVAR
jgi:hypothetical protein